MKVGTRWALAWAFAWLALPLTTQGNPQEGACRQRSVHLNVISRKFQLITGLNASQFTASYQGKPVRILSITPDHSPHRVFILLDASGRQPVHNFTFDVAEELLNDLPASTQVAFGVFGSKATGNWTFSTDGDALRRQLEVLRNERVKGLTALLSAMQQALDTFGEPRDGDSLYVISDGEDNASRLDWSKLTDLAIEHGIRVFAMRVRWTGMGTPDEFGSGRLGEMVTATGGVSSVLSLEIGVYAGRAYDEPLRDSAGKPTSRGAEIDLQARAMVNSGEMLIELPELAGKKRDWNLRLADSKLAKGAILIYPHRLSACFVSAPH